MAAAGENSVSARHKHGVFVRIAIQTDRSQSVPVCLQDDVVNTHAADHSVKEHDVSIQ